MTMQLEEISQKILAKEDLKDTEKGLSNSNKTKLSNVTKENSANK